MIRLAAPALLALAFGCARGAATPTQEPPMSGPEGGDCTVHLSPGDDLAPHLTEGAVLCLKKGVHQASLRLNASLTLRGEPGAVLDAGGRGPVVRIERDGSEVSIQGLELRNGDDPAGSGVVVDGYATVRIAGCTIAGNAPDEGGGNGLRVARGWVTVIDSQIGPEDGVHISSTAEVSFQGGRVEGPVRVLDGAQVRIEGTEVTGPVVLRGTKTRAPVLSLVGTDLTDLRNEGPHPGAVVRE